MKHWLIYSLVGILLTGTAYVASYMVLRKTGHIRAYDTDGHENRIYVAHYAWLAQTFQVIYYPIEYIDIEYVSGNSIEDSVWTTTDSIGDSLL